MNFKKMLLYAAGALLAVSSSISFCTVTDIMGDIRKSCFSGSTAPQQQSTANVGTPTITPNRTTLAAMPLAIGATPSTIETGPMPTLAEVLRFDVTVEWVLQRWPRVTTGLPYLQLQGYRVPLVTGSSVSDVAGSLTYYFNALQQVQRITLRGTTGNPTALVTILTSRHRFARRLTNDPGVVLYEVVDSSNRPAGSLHIRSARVISANQPHTRFEFDLTMDRSE